MTAKELREKYLEFFEERGHAVLPSASLIPENDPTVLFTTAGMHPLVPFLLGEKHPAGKRLTSVQKCIRTGDIDEVGDNWHNTFFEMLGNWSLGDYFKEDAIKMSWEFLTDKKRLGLDKKYLAVTVFAGDEDAPFDKEAYDIWISLGVAPERIAKLPKKDNWWGPAGTTGPCGPDTEMFYWKGEGKPPEKFDPEDSTKSSTEKWVEIWNDVFMQYNKTADGKYEPLAQKNIDTGMGLERTIGVLNGCNSVYETEMFAPLVAKIKEMADADPEEKSVRIIADHIRAATFILGDPIGIVPSNVGQGYILRRLIRRAIRHARKIGIEGTFMYGLSKVIASYYGQEYHELEENSEFIAQELDKEEKKFDKTLERGLKEFEKLENVTGKDAFNLFTTYGFPLELTMELAQDKGVKVDVKEFEEEFKKHQELSRTASAGQFKGGLADAGVETTRLHTAAHLMLAALRKVLGEHVVQRGSNITAERLRFDFSHPQKVTPEEIKKVEEIVNNEISKKTPVQMEEMTVDEAKTAGATGVFEHKYGDKVKVYTIGDFSKEICGGPHVDNIGELGTFKIIKEEASSAGIRRIKAVLE
ncbi:MAG: alanine--tRNA ligase [Patescibacteria group bacterium]|jgi:alanyl-tRNA synthetase